MEQLPAGLSAHQIEVASDTVGGALGLAAHLPEVMATQVLSALQLSFTLALQTNALIGAIIMGGAAWLTGRYLAGAKPHR